MSLNQGLPHLIRRFLQVWQYPLVGGRPIVREITDSLSKLSNYPIPSYCSR